MYKLIIADTSCLILLSKIGQLDLLHRLFDDITITPEVNDEFGEPLPHWINIGQVEDKKRQAILELDLDKGESSAIALALENETSLLLIDERKGRNIAQALGISITGTLGVLVRAKERGFISSIKHAIDALQTVGFRISDAIITSILVQYGE
jgi:predicted nucleic acid-binding protein